MNLHKYKYLISASILSFSVLWGIYGLGSSIVLQHNWCVLDLPPLSSGLFYFVGMLSRLVSPFLSLYVALIFFYVSDKPEKENKLTKIALYLTIFLLVIQFGAYIPFIGMFIQILAYSFSIISFFIPIVVFLLLIVGNFNKYSFIICLGLAILILGGIKISENNHGCSGSNGNSNDVKFEEAVKNNNEDQLWFNT